ncbi:MAG: hypothetical protein JWL76_1334 [Thermoleophilia bacterium]|nr:hypothetical protein [Thermoleophilia bacterium]
MTSINGALPNARVIEARKAAEPEAPVTGGTEATDKGILVSNPSFGRNFLRWGGVAAAVGGAAALAIKAGSGGGIAAVRGTPLLPLAIGGAALGALGLGLSFLGGLQPKYKPLVESGLGNLEDAQAKAAAIGDDVAIVKQSGGQFGIVDFSEKDFDNANLDDLKIDTQDVAWAGLVSKDGDFIRPVGEGRWDVIGRAHPDPVDIGSLGVDQAGSLTGERIGTADSHAAAALGRVIGNPAGYATITEAAKAAHDAKGATAIARLGDKFVLYETAMPNGIDPRNLQARGSGLNPVSALTIEDQLKLFRAGEPGAAFGFVGRSTPFTANEPIGSSINGRRIEKHTASSPDRQALFNALRNDQALIDSTFFGRAGGGALLRSQDPDGTVKFHTYNLSPAGGGGAWDSELANVEATLGRRVETQSEDSFHAPYGADSEWAISQAYVKETHTERTTVSITGDARPLRDSGRVITGTSIDHWATQNYQQRLRDDLYARTHPGTGGGTSPGDDSGTGGTSPGDDSGTGGTTSPGDDGGATRPGTGGTSGGDDGGTTPTTPTRPGNGGSNSGGTAGGDDDGGGTAPTTPTRPAPTTPSAPTSPGNSTDNGNPDEGDF